nr:MAG: RNA-dependent RNA polymerase [Mitovirus sp.]
MLNFISSLHTSAPLMALRSHRLFPKVQWERIEAGNYAVVDPVNPGVILYLSEQDYIVMVRVAITSNRTLKVLAVPGDSPSVSPSSDSSSDSSQNSPSHINNINVPFMAGTVSGTERRRLQTLFSSPIQPFLQRVRERIEGKSVMVKTSMVQLFSRNARAWFNQWYNLLSWWTRGTRNSTVATTERNTFGLWVVQILKHNGASHLIARFKIMLFVLNSFLSGKKLASTQDLGFRVRLSNGLPTRIPRIAREYIRIGHIRYIHIWTSILFAYKGLLGEWMEPNLVESSITQEHPNYKGNDDFSSFQQNFSTLFWYNIIVPLGIKQFDPRVRNAFFTTHAGPNSPISILGAGLDAFLWFCCDANTLQTQTTEVEALVPDIKQVPSTEKLRHIREHIGVPYNMVKEWLLATGQNDLLLSFRKTAKMFKMSYLLSYQVMPHYELVGKANLSSTMPLMLTNIGSKILGLSLGVLKTNKLVLQRLHNLYEAAGKVRTIAIVDYWTNFILKPLHDWMFDILRALPQDATFDQEGKVREFASRGYSVIYSLDLKSATDTIPLALYRALFSWVLPAKILDLWIDLLVNRDFATPISMRKKYPEANTQIRYRTGQPMGALTSWASMALVHHALVLFAAANSGVIRGSALLSFLDYLVLGDDVVIANRRVAEEYIRLCASLGIKIGLNKSFISENGFFNFANQSFQGTVNVSPLSMKEEAQITSLPARAELALRAIRRGWRSVTSNAWLASVLKLFVNIEQWDRFVKPFMVSRTMGPAIAWVLSILLIPGTTRLAFAGFDNIPLESFFGAIARKRGALWGSKLDELPSLVRASEQLALISIISKWVNTIYSDFLRNRKRLEVFDDWVSQIVSPDIEWLLKRVFAEARQEAFSKWTTEYRMPLKKIQVSTRMPNFDIHDVEIGSGMSWTELYKFISQAEKALPQIPDFLQHTIEVLTALAGGADLSATQQKRALAAFIRLTNIIGMVDHLGSFVTPGTEVPGPDSSSDPILLETDFVEFLEERKSP